MENTLKNIIFDFGGVLVDWNQRYYYRGYFKDDQRMEYFLSHVCTSEWNAENDRGRTYAEGVRILSAQYPEFKEAIEMFPLHWTEMLRGEKPEGVALLFQLKELGYHLYGLTNWSAENIHIAFERFPFFSLFEGIVVSGIEQMIKPEEPIYRLLLNRYHLKPQESVFIDDTLANIETAQRLGIAGVLFDNIEHVRHNLSNLLKQDL